MPPAVRGDRSTTHEARFRFFGRTFRVRSTSPEILAYLSLVYDRFHLAHEQPAAPAGEAAVSDLLVIADDLATTGELRLDSARWRYRMTRDGGSYPFSCHDRHRLEAPATGRSDPLRLARSALLRAVADAAAGRHMFHAGAVSVGGRGLVLPATSTRGKTTLVLELVRQGCGFLSDELACLDPASGRLDPFPRRLNLRRSAAALLGLESGDDHPPGAAERAVDVDSLLPGRLAGPCTLSHVMFLDGFADRPHLTPVPALDAVLRLLRFRLTAIAEPVGALQLYGRLAPRLTAYDLVIGPPTTTARLILDLPELAAGAGTPQR